MLVPVLLFLLGFILLIKGGDWFVDGSTDLARRFHVPEIVIGATVVAIGTTLPEVLVSATGALKGHSEIAYGNAIGSVICNTALISAVTFAIRPCKVDTKSFRVPVVFFFIAAVYYALNAYIGRTFSRLSGIVLLLMFAAYIAYTIWDGKKNGYGNPDDAEEELKDVSGGVTRNYLAALDVMNGKYGNGDERIRRLTAAGYDYNAVQNLVNGLAAGYDKVARDVINGKYGNGADRVKALRKAGYDAQMVQDIVNGMLLK